MNPQKQSSSAAIDTEFFRKYAYYQLSRVQKGNIESSDTAEKTAIIQILEACQYINANTFHKLANDLVKHSAQLEPLCEGGLSALFESTANGSNIMPGVNSSLGETPRANARAGQKRAIKDRSRHHQTILHISNNYETTRSSQAATFQEPEEAEADRQPSAQESSTEESDHDEPTIIRAHKKRALSAATFANDRQNPFLSIRQRVSVFNLSDTSIKALNRMSLMPKQAKQEILARMRKIRDSFRIDYSIFEEGETLSTTFDIKFTRRYAAQTIENQCQMNLIAYQLAQIIKKETRMFLSWELEKNKKLYYAKSFGKVRTKSKNRMFDRYGKMTNQGVNEIGFYCLFIPEALPPTFFHKADDELMKTVANFFNAKFPPQFKTIASMDADRSLLIADIEEDKNDENRDV